MPYTPSGTLTLSQNEYGRVSYSSSNSIAVGISIPGFDPEDIRLYGYLVWYSTETRSGFPSIEFACDSRPVYLPNYAFRISGLVTATRNTGIGFYRLFPGSTPVTIDTHRIT